MKDEEDVGGASQASVMHTLTEDVRQQLYSVLKRQGMIDKMKSEMRHRLVMELTTKRPLTKPIPPADGNRSLSQRAADSLVADYLAKRQFEYTLSVFMPEAGLSGQKLLSPPELLDLLHITPHTKFHKQLTATLGSSSDGFLWCFLRQLAERAASGQVEAAAQTEGRAGPLVPLTERLLRIDRQFEAEHAAETAVGQASFEERLMNFQRETEARLRRDQAAELERFKALELSKMRMEEREKLHLDFENKRVEMEAQHRERLQAVTERERAAGEQWKRQQEMWDREAHQRRQVLLEEVDTVRHRETTLRREQDDVQRERRMLAEKKKSTEEELRQREFQLRAKEAEFDSKMNDERTKIRLTEEKKFMDRWRDLEMMEVRAKEEVRLAETEKEGVRKMREEVMKRQSLFDEMEVLDYPTLKQENAALRQEIEDLKALSAELRQDGQKEREKLEAVIRERSGPSKEELEAKREVERMEDTLRQERAMSEHSMQGMQKRLQEEMTQHQKLLQRYEEQSLQLKEMNQEVEDLRQQLRHTENALTNELYRRPRGLGMTPRTGRTGELSARSAAGDVGSMSDEPFSARPSGRRMPLDAVSDLLLPPPLPVTGHGEGEDVDDLVAETKWRLRTLDQETESLQSAYRNFQHRLSNPVYAVGTATLHKASGRGGLLGGDLMEPLAEEGSVSRDWKATNGLAEGWRQPSEPLTSAWAKTSPPAFESRHEETHFESPRVRFAERTMKPSHRTGPTKDASDFRSGVDFTSAPNPFSGLRPDGRHGPEGDVAAGRGADTRGPSSALVTFEMPPDGDRSDRADLLANTSHDAGSTGEQLGPVASGPEAASTTAQSLDDTWRSAGMEREEAEEDDWEERRRRRQEEKARREQEEWEEQQRELARLRADAGPVSAPARVPSPPPAPVKEEEEKKEADNIDPVMLRYMAMVQERRNQPAPPAADPDSEVETEGVVSETDLFSEKSKSDSFW